VPQRGGRTVWYRCLVQQLPTALGFRCAILCAAAAALVSLLGWFCFRQNVEMSVPSPGMVAEGRRMALSLRHRICLSRGEIVNTMVRGGMGHYVEFRALDGAFIHLPSKTPSKDATTYPNAAIYKVPCAKRDLFVSKAFSLIEKRRLSKFLQFCLDWSTTQSGGEVMERNEAGLGQGRSLMRCVLATCAHHCFWFHFPHFIAAANCRPQNKAQVSNYTYDPDVPFPAFLK